MVELILTVVWLIIRDSRFHNCIWEHFLILWFFIAGKSTSRLMYVRNQQILISQCTGWKKLTKQRQLTNLWRRDRLWCETIAPTTFFFFALFASALKRLLDKHIHFRKRESVEEQRAQKYDRFLWGRQIALHDLRAMPCNRRLWSGTRTLRFVQHAFAEWRRPRLRRSIGSSSIISKRNAFRCDPGRIVQVKITGLCSASDCLGFVRPRNCSKQWTDKLFTIEDSCRTSYWSDDENSKFLGSERSCGKRSSHQEWKKKEAYVERKVGECFQWKTHGQCFKGDPCSFSHDKIASGNRVKGRSSSPASNSKAKTDGKEQRWRFWHEKSDSMPIQDFFKKPSCKFWHLPVRQNYRSEKGCIYGDKCHFRHVEATKSPAKSQRKGGAKGSVALLKESTQVGCVSQGSYPRKSIPREPGRLRSKHARRILQRHLAPNKNSGETGSTAMNCPKVCASWVGLHFETSPTCWHSSWYALRKVSAIGIQVWIFAGTAPLPTCFCNVLDEAVKAIAFCLVLAPARLWRQKHIVGFVLHERPSLQQLAKWRNLPGVFHHSLHVVLPRVWWSHGRCILPLYHFRAFVLLTRLSARCFPSSRPDTASFRSCL